MVDVLSVLVLDDESQIAHFIERIAQRIGFQAHTLNDPREFVETFRRIEPSVVVLDLQMPGMDGIEILRLLAGESHKANILISSGADRRVLKTAADLASSHGLTVVSTLQKPLVLKELESCLAGIAARVRPLSPDALEAAIKNDELLVLYQAQATREGGRWMVTATEALVRWQHPVRGLLSPGDFLSVAEENGLMRPLTEYVLRQVAAQVKVWQDAGLPLRVSVNLSANTMDDLEFPDRLRDLLRDHGVAPDRIFLELTESAVTKNSATTMDILARLRLLGVGLSIDDFGTGNSSFMRLYEMPFNELKIDRSFVAKIPHDEEARTIILAMVELAHALGMTACAEGVESPKILDYLESIACDAAQGYHIGKPMTAQELEAVVKVWNGVPQSLVRLATAS